MQGQRHSFILSNLTFKSFNFCFISVSIIKVYIKKIYIAIKKKTAIIVTIGKEISMANLIESYKKVFENKKAHISLAIIAILWTIVSTIWDAKTGNINNYRQNPFDILFNVIVGAYSIKFLHNAINNIDNGVLPSFKHTPWIMYLGMIKLNIVWGLYAAIFLILTILIYMLTHFLALPILLTIALLFVAMFIYYIFLTFADNLETKGLFNIKLIFKLIPHTIKPLYKNFIMFLLLTLLIVTVYILIYILAGLAHLDKIININLADDIYLFDLIMNIIASYIVIITWYFAFPYSLIDSYREFIKPVLRKDENNGTNA